MIESLYIAESGMTSQQELIDVISNNIANVSTSGFKKSQLNFIDLVYRGQSEGASATESNNWNGAGVMVSSTALDHSVGDLKSTGNPFDLAIQGKGFLQLEMDDGSVAYSRAGRLRLDENGFLTSLQGYKLVGDLQIPPDSKAVEISDTGEVFSISADDQRKISIGVLELVRFTNDSGLRSIGNNLYQASDESGEVTYARPGEAGTGKVLQGVTELSNVSMTEEMVNLMLAQRGYQLNARIIQISDQLLDTVNNLRR